MILSASVVNLKGTPKKYGMQEKVFLIYETKNVCEGFITSTKGLIVSHQEYHNSLRQHMLFCISDYYS